MRWENVGEANHHGSSLMVGQWQVGERELCGKSWWWGKTFLPMGKEVASGFFATEEEAGAFVEGQCRYWISKLNEGLEE
jgi:hypothetical protein